MLNYRQTQEARHQIGEMVKNDIPENENIISGDLGMIGYTSIKHNFIDMFGLVSNIEIGDAKYVADTMQLDNNGNLLSKVKGNYKLIKYYKFTNKPYIIGLAKYN